MFRKPSLITNNKETIVFDGINSVTLPTSNSKITLDYSDEFSISFWIKTRSSKVSAILAKMIDAMPFTGWDVLINGINSPRSLRFQLIHSYPDNWIEVAIDAADILDDNWHNVVITFGGINKADAIIFFIDGKERPKTVISDCLTKSIANSFPITIGSRSNGGIEFNGCISDLRIYSSKLSANQVNDFLLSSEVYQKNVSKTVVAYDAVILKNVNKIYHLHHNSSTTIFEKLNNLHKRKKHVEELLVLDGINLRVKQGEMIGIIGLNGSGKTTLLKIMAGIIKPTKGKVIINGVLAPFLSLGSGFNPEFDAKENIIMYGMLLGTPKNKIKSQVDEILKFAELEHFHDVKLKNFSSGMFMRLAFSVAVSLNPDIILIDEILSVGDASFQHKSFQKLLSFKEEGKSIILVTHNLEQVENLCNRAVFIEKGHIVAEGSPKEVVDRYKNSLR